MGIEEENLENALKTMKERYNIKSIACTIRKMEGKASYYQGLFLHENVMYQSKLYPLQILDRIGAGDAYAAGIIAGILEKKDNQYIVDFATCAGVLAHTTYGDSPISTIRDIEAVIKGQCANIIR